MQGLLAASLAWAPGPLPQMKAPSRLFPQKIGQIEKENKH